MKYLETTEVHYVYVGQSWLFVINTERAYLRINIVFSNVVNGSGRARSILKNNVYQYQYY